MNKGLYVVGKQGSYLQDHFRLRVVAVRKQVVQTLQKFPETMLFFIKTGPRNVKRLSGTVGTLGRIIGSLDRGWSSEISKQVIEKISLIGGV